MDPKEFGNFKDAREEREHWWIQSRFAWLAAALDHHLQGREGLADLLEVGAGTCQNIWFLRTVYARRQRIGRIIAMEPALALAFRPDWHHPNDCFATALGPEMRGSFLLAMDILEHIEDDLAALCAWVKHVEPGGTVFLTVPASMRLWSYHDELLDHHRRYSRQSLIGLALAAGLTPLGVRYAFSILYPAALVLRKVRRYQKKTTTSDLRPPPPLLNLILRILFTLEQRCGGSRYIGTSVIGTFHKPRQKESVTNAISPVS